MRALLDTNIIIHRENKSVSNYSVGHLFRWLDKLGYQKLVHPLSYSELDRYEDDMVREAMSVKLDSYEKIRTTKHPDRNFLSLVKGSKISPNDEVDNHLLYEVYLNRVDILITEDRKMLAKAGKLGIADRVYSINSFINMVTAENPELVDYKMLAVKKVFFGELNLADPFFDTFKRDYREFEKWFNRKCDEIAYVCKDENQILGFLYLKIEDETESYSDISPVFPKARRLKVGTFKVESTGFRLGERFVKIILDNALQYKVDEVYVTLFDERQELQALSDLLMKWGFVKYGTKTSDSGEEIVLVKPMKIYREELPPKMNFPNISYNKRKFILPIMDEYHTTLLPDSKLKTENEVDFMEKLAHRYALEKVYISWSPERNIHSGDILVFYRMGAYGTNKKYSSVITTIGVVDEVITELENIDELMACCQNRSVFSKDDLNRFWSQHSNNLMIIKFIYVESLTKRLTLAYLWENGIVTPPSGPRPFHRLNNSGFDKILRDSNTELSLFK